jgi:hypothetical protein
MSHCIYTGELGGEERQFALYLGQWEELEGIVNCGPLELFNKLARLEFRANWLREITRLGLIGGGMNPIEAKKLVTRYVDNVPFSEAWPLAFQIVARACHRPNEEGNSKKKEETEGDQTVSTSGRFLETVQ